MDLLLTFVKVKKTNNIYSIMTVAITFSDYFCFGISILFFYIISC